MLVPAIAETACRKANMLADRSHLTAWQLVLAYMHKEIIKEILTNLTEFEKSGDWYYFSVAIDSLNELITEIDRDRDQD